MDAMLPYLVSYYGNPHSRTHAYGWETEAAVEKARKVCCLNVSDTLEFNKFMPRIYKICLIYLTKTRLL